MTILVTCPHCHAMTEVPRQLAGQSGPCRECGQVLQVPWPSAEVSSAGPMARSRLGIALRSGMVASALAGLATLILLTLPEVGPVLGVLQAAVVPDPADEQYHRLLIGHGVLWLAITGLTGFLVALLVGVLAAMGVAVRKLDVKCQGAGWGGLVAMLLATVAALLYWWGSGLLLTSSLLFGRLLVVLACGTVGALVGYCCSGRYSTGTSP